jgi:glucose dehydrogenase
MPGRVQTIWKYTRRLPADVASHCTVMTNRGLAVLGDRLFLATLDMHLIAFDAKSRGDVIWDVVQDDYRLGYLECPRTAGDRREGSSSESRLASVR